MTSLYAQNSLTVEVYSTGTTAIVDARGELANVSNIYLNKIWPGGLFGYATFNVPREAIAEWQVKLGYRIVFRNGLAIAWEGYIASIGFYYYGGAEQGWQVTCYGAWGWILGRRYINRKWLDTYIDGATWVTQTANNENLGTDDRLSRERITPKGVAWGNTNFYRIRYTAPTGETVKRIKATSTIVTSAAAPKWTIRIRDNTGAANAFTVSRTTAGTSGPTAQDNTPAAAAQTWDLEFISDQAQTPVEDGTVYGQVTSVQMFASTANTETTVTGKVIARDCINKLGSSVISTDETQLNAGLDFIAAGAPFISQGYESWASILSRINSYGDSSFNSWAAYLTSSESGTTTSGVPVLHVEQYPALTSADYLIRVDEENVVPPFEIVYDIEKIINYVIVRYTDANGYTQYRTPDDNSALKDSTSITTYGQRERVVDAGPSSSGNADSFGQRWLAAYKNPIFYVSGPIVVEGYLRDANSQPIAASLVATGKRIKVENFLTDLASVTGAGLTFYITGADYDDKQKRVSLTTGLGDNLAVWLAQRTILDNRVI